MDTLAEFVIGIFQLLIDLVKMIWGVVPKAASFTLWLLSAAIVLPCVYIAAVWFPKWNDWGSKF